MARVYATLDDYEDYLGKAPPADFDAESLVRASARIDRALLGAIYATHPTTQLPTDPDVAEAMRDATCAQALWWDEIGDSTGSGALQEFGELQIGQVRLRRSGNSRGEAAVREA